MTLWGAYQRFRTSLQARIRRNPGCIEPLAPHVSKPRKQNHYLAGDRIIDAELNEFWLWHGTDHNAADILVESGFDERQANLHGLYGAGSYFADAMCKSNQYVKHCNDDGEYTMLYCRVLMGTPFKTKTSHSHERRPPLNPSDSRQGATFDSIFAQNGVAQGGTQKHNEFVVFRDYQVYPEFLVRYTR
jgi:hypothetical protein